MRKSSPGFTMVELLAAIAASALVMAAALSFMLMGLRIERSANNTAAAQQAAHIVLTVSEKMAMRGDIREIRQKGDGWASYNEAGELRLQYSAANESLLIGDTVLLENVESAEASLEDKLFTLKIETEYGDYTTTVYCRFDES